MFVDKHLKYLSIYSFTVYDNKDQQELYNVESDVAL